MKAELSAAEIQQLHAVALRVREHIIRWATGGGCFIGASLSCADLLVYLYSKVLNITPQTVKNRDRDYLLLSKGHDVPALYGTFAELGFIEPARLKNHLSIDDSLYWHPNRDIPGVEFHSGSLGHLLGVGVGIALDLKMCRDANRVFVILGDGELNEGSIWEACLVAKSYHLSNVVAVVDRNQFQANIETEKLLPLEPVEDKFRAFGWQTLRTDGHDFESLHAAFLKAEQMAKANPTSPIAVIADTVRGKGLPSIEQRADRWFVDFKPQEIESLLRELHGAAAAQLTSTPLVVR